MPSRRDFLRITVVTLGSAALPGCGETSPSTSAAPRVLEEGSKFFPQSVASGDPRPNGAILWTRIEDEDRKGWDLDLEVEVALDKEFTQPISVNGQERALVLSESKYDNCVKVRFVGDPGKTYYYRFIYEKNGRYYKSPTGRVKTAPATTADAEVRFAFVSCQDFIGRYYNVLWSLAEQNLDFFVHLGDYIYETTGDPSFQTPDPNRRINFRDTAGSLELVTPDDKPFYAARTLSNYRDLYRTYRSDPALQSLHESCAVLATWDDHEFSDDCWGANGTYNDGRSNEEDVARRKAANQAWFEYMPVDYPSDPEFRYDSTVAFPDDLRIERDFQFGKHVHLVLTDLRTHRPDHLIAEDAYPGTVVYDQKALEMALGALPPLGIVTPYVNVDTYGGGLYKVVMSGAAKASGYTDAQIAAVVKGNLNVFYINAVVDAINNGPMPPPMPIPAITPDMNTEMGISHFDLNKIGFYSSIGSRYFVHKDSFDVYAALRKADQDLLGADQEKWLLDTITNSTATWKIWGTSFVMCPVQLDLRQQPVPAAFKRRFYMNLDGWDGFRDKRDELIGKLAPIGNVVAISGDLHTFMAGTPWVGADPTKKIVEFTCGAVSSSPYKAILLSQIKADPYLSQVPAAPLLASNIDSLLVKDPAKPNPHLAHANSESHGFCIATVNAQEMIVNMHFAAATEVTQNYAGKTADFGAKIQVDTFKAIAGESNLYKMIDGDWKKWDPMTATWI